MNKRKKSLLLWFLGVNVLGYVGYKLFSSSGECKAYDTIAEEIDKGDTVIMTKSNGKVVVVKKVCSEED